MNNINKRFQDSLEHVVQVHFSGNTTKSRWELRPNKKSVLLKLRLVLSWVMGARVLKLEPKEIMYHILEYYKRLNHHGYLEKKYGK